MVASFVLWDIPPVPAQPRWMTFSTFTPELHANLQKAFYSPITHNPVTTDPKCFEELG
jgi:hypothetical protein